MILKTKNYAIFKYKKDNRPLDQAHVKRLVKSISSQNLLEWRPIEVNKEMEIIDGQHRLKASEELNLEIYYKKIDSKQSDDIIHLNVSKSWTMNDFFNYYLKNEKDEYKKLEAYMKKHEVSLKLALAISNGQGHDYSDKFRLGTFVFNIEQDSEVMENCQTTIDFIKKMNGFSGYTSNNRFWMALIKLVTHNNFNMVKWQFNLSRMVNRFGPRATHKDYVDMFMNCYNWKNNERIEDLD